MTTVPKLANRVAVVTGAGQGLGRAIALRYAAEGAWVAVVDMNEETAGAVVDEIREAGGKALAYACDVSKRAQVEQTATTIAADLGPISILVNNAGVSRPAMLWKMTDEQWQTVMATHVDGSFYWLRAVVPAMQEARRGHIIFTSSAAGIQGTIGQINYASAKAALLGMMRSAARELAQYGIVVNATAPVAATPMTETVRNDERFQAAYLDKIPLHRWAEPEEVAGTYAFLASDEANYITGQVLPVDGGMVMVR